MHRGTGHWALGSRAEYIFEKKLLHESFPQSFKLWIWREMFSKKFYNSEHKILVNQVPGCQHWACSQGAWDILSSLIKLTPHPRYQEKVQNLGLSTLFKMFLPNVPLEEKECQAHRQKHEEERWRGCKASTSEMGS